MLYTCTINSGGFEGAEGARLPNEKSAPLWLSVILYSTTYNVGLCYWTTMK